VNIRILGKTYTVQFVDRKDLPNDYGECNDEQQLIKIRTDISDENKKDVLLHEVIHAIDFAMSTELTERQVHAIATGLLAVFLDNSDFWSSYDNGQRKDNRPRSKVRQSD